MERITVDACLDLDLVPHFRFLFLLFNESDARFHVVSLLPLHVQQRVNLIALELEITALIHDFCQALALLLQPNTAEIK